MALKRAPNLQPNEDQYTRVDAQVIVPVVQVDANGAPIDPTLGSVVIVSTASGAGATIGAGNQAAVITDANGTLQQYLRGLIKLAITAGGLLVTGSASEAHIGQVGGSSIAISVTPTLTVGATYAANDYVGTSGVPMTFANALRTSGGTALLQTVIVNDYTGGSVAGELWLFNADPTPPADSAAWTITDANSLKCIGVVPIATFYASAANSVGIATNVGILLQGVASTSIFGCFVTRGAPAYASGDLTVTIVLSRD